jgi:hypothetical protein
VECVNFFRHRGEGNYTETGGQTAITLREPIPQTPTGT